MFGGCAWDAGRLYRLLLSFLTRGLLSFTYRILSSCETLNRLPTFFAVCANAFAAVETIYQFSNIFLSIPDCVYNALTSTKPSHDGCSHDFVFPSYWFWVASWAFLVSSMVNLSSSSAREEGGTGAAFSVQLLPKTTLISFEFGHISYLYPWWVALLVRKWMAAVYLLL